jgi:hypothetical protein
MAETISPANPGNSKASATAFNILNCFDLITPTSLPLNP